MVASASRRLLIKKPKRQSLKFCFGYGGSAIIFGEPLSPYDRHAFNGPFSGTTQVSQYQKGKTNLDFTEARDSEYGISWAVCKSAPRSRQITMPATHHSVFTGRMPFLPPNQQRQSRELQYTVIHYILQQL